LLECPGTSASAIGITALVRALLVPAELEQPGVKRARKLSSGWAHPYKFKFIFIFYLTMDLGYYKIIKKEK
tara:strand:+ start:161 stop:373 length:213 start_codon:yes stop_codon:yes gene_type:complete